MDAKFYHMIFLFALFIGENASAQGSIDSFINTLHNTNAVSAVALVAPSKTFDSGKIYGHTTERVLTGLNINRIKKAYPKYLLVKKLVQSLGDSERDWYADLLLYNLTKISSLNIIPCSTREKWLKPKPNTNMTHKEADVEMWRKYLAGLSISDKW